MLQSHESLDLAKEKLLEALKLRGLSDINGDPIPYDSFDIEFGEPVDRADFEKGWKLLRADAPGLDDEGVSKKDKGKGKNESMSLLEAGIENGHTIAFRFRKSNEDQNADLEMDIDEDPGWDVIIPSYEDEEEEE